MMVDADAGGGLRRSTSTITKMAARRVALRRMESPPSQVVMRRHTYGLELPLSDPDQKGIAPSTDCGPREA